MKTILTLILVLPLFCFAQKKQDVTARNTVSVSGSAEQLKQVNQPSKLDSIQVNAFEDIQLKNYIQGDKAKEILQLQERIVFLQREVQLLMEAKQTAIQTPMARENKQGEAIAYRNGFLILQKK